MRWSWQGRADAPTVPSLSASQRRTFVAVADQLIPGDEHMPAASEVDVGGDRLDGVLRSRPDLADPLLRVLGDAPETRLQAWVDDLARVDPAGHRALVVAVLATYYLSEEVRRRLGYPGQTASAVSLEFPPYVEEGLLEAVVERGPLYRQPEADGPSPSD